MKFEMKMFNLFGGNEKSKSTDVSEKFNILNEKIDTDISKKLKNLNDKIDNILNILGNACISKPADERIREDGNRVAKNYKNVNREETIVKVDTGNHVKSQSDMKYLIEPPTKEENAAWIEYEVSMNQSQRLKYNDALTNRYSERFAREQAGFRYKES